MVTFGFYDSINHDRRYNSTQFGSIFDGIVRDGVFMSIGSKLMVTPANSGMMVLVGTGRAWFDHTWTLNDAPLPLIVPQSEIILSRIDAVVIETNHTQGVRANTIKIVKGTPSSNPVNPTLINTVYVHQYPLAYIRVNANVTTIRAANITNMVGTSQTPFVTGILETMNIDALIAQWKDQWDEYREFWENEWENWYLAQTNEIQDAFEIWQDEWTAWSENYKHTMELTARQWNALWQQWFYTFINQNEQDWNTWLNARDKEFRDWFNSLQVLLDGDVVTNLANQILSLQGRVDTLENFADDLRFEHAVYYDLYANTYDKHDYVLDNDMGYVLDDDTDKIIGRSYEEEIIQDNNGVPINVRTVFCVSCTQL